MRYFFSILLFILALSSQAQLNISLLGKLSYDKSLSNVWGYVDEFGNEYALVGVKDGLSIVSLADPANPVEIKRITGTETNWHEIKTYGDFVYVSNEAGDGLMIVDLSPLPASTNFNVNYDFYTRNAQTATAAHTLFIDSAGYCCLFGTDRNQETIILDIKSNPLDPVEVGYTGLYYAHDGEVVGDTMYLAHINEGFVGVYNIVDKANPVLITTFSTPNNFTHNVAYSKDQQSLYTTDEKSGSYVAAYDVSDFTNISELDRFQRKTSVYTIPHNTHFLDYYLITSYYLEGVSIIDALNNNNLVEVGHFDTTPSDSGYAFSGVWGVYPYLPSGLILASDMFQGLYVLDPNYVRAAKVHGVVKNTNTLSPINNVNVNIKTTNITDVTDFIGNFSIGYHTPGTYDLAFSKFGYYDTTVSVNILAGLTQTVQVFMREKPKLDVVFKIVDSNYIVIPSAKMQIETIEGGLWNLTSDNSGLITTQLIGKSFEVITGKWNYKTVCTNYIDASFSDTIVIELKGGIYDDFSLDFSWLTSGNPNQGEWVRVVPIATYFATDTLNAAYDFLEDCGNLCYVTGNTSNPDFTFNKVDQDFTTITSPLFNVSSYANPILSFELRLIDYAKWHPANDTVFISLISISDTIPLDTLLGADFTNQATYRRFAYELKKYTQNTSGRLFISMIDVLPNNVLEASLDLFQIKEEEKTKVPTVTSLTLFPNPTSSFVQIKSAILISKIKVYDVQGKLLSTSTEINAFETYVDLENYNSGFYFIEVFNSENRSQTLKVALR